jgi:hypothetical protein
MSQIRGSNEEKLDTLFRAFAACPIPEPSANFMPTLWRKIEAMETFTFLFRRMANGFAAIALVLTVVLSVYMYVPRSSLSLPSQSYLEFLADANPIQSPALVSSASLESTNPDR